MRTPVLSLAPTLSVLLLICCGSTDSGPEDWASSAAGVGGVAGTPDSGPSDGAGGKAGQDASKGGGAGTSAGGKDAAIDPKVVDVAPEAAGCGVYEGKQHFNCAPDGLGRGKCVSGGLVFESCAKGCLIKPEGEDDVCLGDDANWSCDGTMGDTKAGDGDYYLTSFGCWTDEQGSTHQDSGDNCIPGCLSKIKSAGICSSSMSGPECEESVNWYTADSTRFGCLSRLRITNPKNGKAVIAVVFDGGPACWVEQKVNKALLDASSRVGMYLFGTTLGWSDKALVHVVEVDKSTPLGPVP